MAKWVYSYRYANGGGSFCPLTKEGPPYESLTVDGDTPQDAARAAKELYPGHIAESTFPFDLGEPEIILISRHADGDEPEPGDVMAAIQFMQPTLFSYATLERHSSALDFMQGLV